MAQGNGQAPALGLGMLRTTAGLMLDYWECHIIGWWTTGVTVAFEHRGLHQPAMLSTFPQVLSGPAAKRFASPAWVAKNGNETLCE